MFPFVDRRYRGLQSTITNVYVFPGLSEWFLKATSAHEGLLSVPAPAFYTRLSSTAHTLSQTYQSIHRSSSENDRCSVPLQQQQQQQQNMSSRF